MNGDAWHWSLKHSYCEKYLENVWQKPIQGVISEHVLAAEQRGKIDTKRKWKSMKYFSFLFSCLTFHASKLLALIISARNNTRIWVVRRK